MNGHTIFNPRRIPCDDATRAHTNPDDQPSPSNDASGASSFLAERGENARPSASSQDALPPLNRARS